MATDTLASHAGRTRVFKRDVQLDHACKEIGSSLVNGLDESLAFL